MSGPNEEFEAAKQRLQQELHDFLADVLAKSPGQIEAFASAVKSAVEAKGVSELRLSPQIEGRIQRIEEALEAMRSSERPAVERQFALIQGQLDEGIKSLATAARQAQAVKINLGHRGRSGGAEDAATGNEVESLSIKLHMPRPDWRAWLPAVVAVAGGILSVLAATLLPRPAAPPTQAGGANSQTVATVEKKDDAAQRGWTVLLNQAGRAAPAPELQAAVCGPAAEGCNDFESRLEQWQANAAIPIPLVREIALQGPTLCPRAMDDKIPDSQVRGLLACLREAGSRSAQ